MTGPSESEAREFAASFQSFLQWVHSTDLVRSEVPDVVAAFLGDRVSDRSVVSRSLRPFEHVNLQTALDAWSREPGREVVVQGISVPPHHGGASLQQIISAEGIGRLRG
jgi:cell division protease FtsH